MYGHDEVSVSHEQEICCEPYLCPVATFHCSMYFIGHHNSLRKGWLKLKELLATLLQKFIAENKTSFSQHRVRSPRKMLHISQTNKPHD